MKDFTLTFTNDEMVVINNAIIMLPYHIAAPLIDSINKQITKAKSEEIAS